MNKTLKRIIIAVLITALVCGLAWGGLTMLKNAKRGTVNVYPITDFYTDYGASTAQCSGFVTTDKLQKVYISETQTVKEVFVTEGQEVKVGDKLVAFDTTLGDLDLRQAQIALERQTLELQLSRDTLQKLLNAKTTEQLADEYENVKQQLAEARAEAGIADPDAKPEFPEGDGSFEKPLCVLWDETGDMLTQQRLADILGEMSEAYVLLLTEDETDYYICQGLRLVRLPESGEIAVSFVSGMEIPFKAGPDKTETVRQLEKQLEDIQLLMNEAHSKLELTKLQNEKRREISQREVELKIAQLELRRLRSEIEDGVVCCTIDGTVTVVRDANEAYKEGTALVEVSGGGGYYIEGAVSELALGTVSVGQSVEINSWMTGTVCTGEIVEISSYPTENANAWSEGNTNVSFYPMRVFVDESAGLREDDWVDMSYETAGNGGCPWYLDKMFIRSENGRSYVFVQGEDELLEKRFIQTGASLWGSYTGIKGGITPEDYLAFPYGKDVVDGAKTRQATIDELYGW